MISKWNDLKSNPQTRNTSSAKLTMLNFPVLNCEGKQYKHTYEKTWIHRCQLSSCCHGNHA